MAMVKLRASCASGIYRCMKSKSQTLSLLHTHTASPSKFNYPSWEPQAQIVWQPQVPKVSNKDFGNGSISESESESESEYQMRSRCCCRRRGDYSGYGFLPPKLDPWKTVVEDRENLPVSERFEHEGEDYKHWRVSLKPLRGHPTRDQFVSYYLRTLSQLLHSEEEALKKIYSVATKHYFAFGANISPEQADAVSEFPNVIKVYPDYYQDPKVKRYSWDSFVNGQVLSYDPKNYPPPDVRESLCDEELEITGLPVPFRKHAIEL